MNQPLIVTVDSAKGIARMSGPLTLGNTYKVGWSGLTDAEAHPTETDPDTGEVTYQGPQLVLLGIPQLTDEWENGNPETRVAAMTDEEDVLALNTAELVDAFKTAPPSPMPPVPPRDPRRPAQPMGVALHGTARPHGAIRLHFYVTAGGATLAQGDCTLLWAPFEFDGSGTPVVLQGPKGEKGEQGEQGPQGERGADAAIVRGNGCVTFAVDHDESSDTYGHLFAYSDDADALYHHGDTSKPHWWLGTGSNGGTAGHLYYTYYPADPATAATVLDLGDVRGPQGPTDSGAVFAATLKSELEQNAGEMAAWNLNTAIRLANAIKNAIFAATGQVTALLLAFVLPFFIGGTAQADIATALGDMDPTNTVYTSQQVDALMEDIGSGSGFPLEEDADFSGHSATNVAGIQFSGDTNVLAVSDGKLRYGGKSISGVANLVAGQNIALSTNDATEAVTVAVTDNVSFDDVQVRGDLTIYGQQNINTIRRYYTNVYVGVQTTKVATVIHTTNHVAEVTTVTTRTTNHVDEVVNVGGNVDHSKAASVLSPAFSIDNSDTNNPVLTGTGTWDLKDCDLELGEDCYVEPLVKPVDVSGTNSFSTDNFYLQQLDLSGEASAGICWNKPDVAPFALMHCRIRIGTATNCATVSWTTNNVLGFDATAVSTSRWSWVQLESYPNSPNFSVVSQWTEPEE